MKILDSSVIIALFSESEGSIIIDKWGETKHRLIIPKSVFKELSEKKEGEPYTSLVLYLKTKRIYVFRDVDESDLEYLKKRYPYLGKGEIEVLYWGKIKNVQSCYCVIDDMAARKAATKERLTLTGTIGLINRLVEKNMLDKNKRNTIFKELKKNGFRFPKDLLL